MTEQHLTSYHVIEWKDWLDVLETGQSVYTVTSFTQ